MTAAETQSQIPQQLPLSLALPRRRARGRAGFIVSAANDDALKLIDGWRNWPEGRLAIFGPEGSGKTHLAHVWMQDAGAEKVAAVTLSAEDAPALISAGAVVVEDGDRIEGRAQEHALFHLLNLARAEGCAVLLTGRTAPVRWRVATPDLASRLTATPAVALEPPDEALMRDLLIKHFSDRHLKVGEDVIAFLVPRLPRAAAAAGAITAQLDDAALTQSRKITVPFVKEVLDV
ncbi:MAG: HdaA/DnaA family protein [Pikeienuella sp.]